MTVTSERKAIALISLVQFVNILDFVMVMPLGPDFSKSLGVPHSHLGYIGGSYTAAAAIAGLIGSLFLDRFDRKRAFLFSVFGLAFGTLMAVFSQNFTHLLCARVLAGIFGGPTSSIAMAMISDLVPPQRRGKALAIVMGTFSLASILGVPLGLEMARLMSWKAPFFVVSALALFCCFLIHLWLPNFRGHLKKEVPIPHGESLQFSKWADVSISFSLTAASMIAAFMLIPNFSAYFQFNLGYPREKLGFLYFVGGIASLFLMHLGGRLVDRFGSSHIILISVLGVFGVIWAGYYNFPPVIPPVLIFIGYMGTMSLRNVSSQSLTSKVPPPQERAWFMSLQSCVSHLSCAAGAFLSSIMLKETESGALQGMHQVATVSLAFIAVVPVLGYILESRIKTRVH